MVSMLPLGLLLLATASGRGVDGSDCGCYGKCDNPIVNGTRDCPAVGYDCHRAHAALGLFTKYAHGDDVTLKCAESKATLFVKGKSQKKVKCRRGSGSWKGSCGCEAIESALCALPCTTCSTLVPGFLSLDATSISVLPATVGQPCAIGFCNGIGLTLTGIDSVNTSVTIDGNLTCSGTGWMDRNGRVYSYAVCQYYGNCPAISLGAPSANTVSLLTSGGRSVSCPVGALLTYMHPRTGVLQTQYPLACGPDGTWQLYGMYWNATYFRDATCTTYEPCTISIPATDACAADGALCRPVSQTIVPFGTANVTRLSCADPDYGVTIGVKSVVGNTYICSGERIINVYSPVEIKSLSCQKSATCTNNVKNIANVICASDTQYCSPAIVTGASIACPAGLTLIYEADGEYAATMGNLTCYNGMYRDTDSTDTNHGPSLSSVDGVTCTNKANLACKRLPFLFTTGGIEFEYTPGSYDYVALSRKVLTTTNGQWQMLLQTSADIGVIYYNNWTNVAEQLRCGDDQMWHAPDNTVVTAATAQETVCTITPSSPEGYDPITMIPSSYGLCHTAIVYQTPGGSIQTLSAPSNTHIRCTPNDNFALPVDNGYFVPPPGTLIGCTKT